MSAYDWLNDWIVAGDGVLPQPRTCRDAVDAAFWFWCVSLALRAQREAAVRADETLFRTICIRLPGTIRGVSTLVRADAAPEDHDARKGRTTPNVRR